MAGFGQRESRGGQVKLFAYEGRVLRLPTETQYRKTNSAPLFDLNLATKEGKAIALLFQPVAYRWTGSPKYGMRPRLLFPTQLVVPFAPKQPAHKPVANPAALHCEAVDLWVAQGCPRLMTLAVLKAKQESGLTWTEFEKAVKEGK